jgi:hypothetical protein
LLGAHVFCEAHSATVKRKKKQMSSGKIKIYIKKIGVFLKKSKG